MKSLVHWAPVLGVEYQLSPFVQEMGVSGAPEILQVIARVSRDPRRMGMELGSSLSALSPPYSFLSNIWNGLWIS